MLPLLFFAQAATAPVGGYGGITFTQAGSQTTATAWYGGKKLGSFTDPSFHVVSNNARILLSGYRASLVDPHPDN